MKNILVSIDFDDKEKVLLHKALEFGKAFNAFVSIVHIAAPDPDFIGYDVGPQYIRDSRADELKEEHKLLQKYAEDLKQKGVDSKALLIQGSTIDTILEETIKLKSDLIILGQHKKSILYKAFFGSVSEEVMRNTDIPVLIVPL
jgi:nucleotide-binding universal stress UspA family protein